MGISSFNLDALAKIVQANQKLTEERFLKLEAKLDSSEARLKELELLSKPLSLSKVKLNKDLSEIKAKAKDIIQTKVFDEAETLFGKSDSKDLYSHGLEDRIHLLAKSIYDGDQVAFTKNLNYEKSLIDKLKANKLVSEIVSAGAKHNLQFDFVELYSAYN